MFATTWRIAAAGCAAYAIGEFINSYVVSKMKILQKARMMPVRFIASTIVGQFFDTAVFITIAFAGTLPWKDFLTMFVAGWMAKILYEIVALPISIPVARWIKRLEGIEHFDKQKISIV